MSQAAIALGSNLAGVAGSREANLAGAVLHLCCVGEVVGQSAWLQTQPVGYLDQPAFLNGALLLQTRLPPTALLAELLRIEQLFGRDRSHGIANGPRTLDLDLLFYDDLVLQSPGLTLPHPELARRRFVLEPLAAVAPNWRHPLLKSSVAELLASVLSNP